MTLCHLGDVGGTPGQGIHALRVPGTCTAMFDFVGTLLAGWLLSWISNVDLSTTVMLLLACGMFFHKLFCVDIGGDAA